MGAVKHSCPVPQEDLGPYLLGQLDAAEHARMTALVEQCPSCQAQVEELRPVADVLRRGPVEPSRVAPQRPPDAVLGDVLTQVQHDRNRVRRRRWVLAGASLGAVAATAFGITLLVTDEVGTVDLVGRAGASGSARVAAESWGTRIELRVQGLDPGADYGVWLAQEDGDRTGAGTFRPADEGLVVVSLSSSLDLGDSAELGVSRIPASPDGEAVDVLTGGVGE